MWVRGSVLGGWILGFMVVVGYDFSFFGGGFWEKEGWCVVGVRSLGGV